jgi:hypothetical protein
MKGSEERFPSGQREQTVNLPAMPSKVRILPSPPILLGGNSSVGRARAFQARGRGFESRFPLQIADGRWRNTCRNPNIGNRAEGHRLIYAQVAQSVEHVLGKDEVGGSSPLLGFRSGISMKGKG